MIYIPFDIDRSSLNVRLTWISHSRHRYAYMYTWVFSYYCGFDIVDESHEQ